MAFRKRPNFDPSCHEKSSTVSGKIELLKLQLLFSRSSLVQLLSKNVQTDYCANMCNRLHNTKIKFGSGKRYNTMSNSQGNCNKLSYHVEDISKYLICIYKLNTFPAIQIYGVTQSKMSALKQL